MPGQLRCEVYVSSEGDQTGENAIECRAIALACVDCGESAGCVEHALMCQQCRRAVCDCCAYEHSCVANENARAVENTSRAA